MVLDTFSKPIDFGIKRSSVRGTGCDVPRIFGRLPNARRGTFTITAGGADLHLYRLYFLSRESTNRKLYSCP